MITALLPRALPLAPQATPEAWHSRCAWSQADPCVETTAFNQWMHLGRNYGPHQDMGNVDSLCDLQELVLCQPVPTLSALSRTSVPLVPTGGECRSAMAPCSFSSLFRCVLSSSCTWRSFKRKSGLGHGSLRVHWDVHLSTRALHKAPPIYI